MIAAFERKFFSFYLQCGEMLLLLAKSVGQLRFGRNDRSRLLAQAIRVGYETVPLAMLIGLFTGMTLALGTGLVLDEFGQEVLIASIVSEAMIKEMGPVFTAFIISARVGAAMTAEIGTMAVNEELNVLRVLGIRVDRYIVMPRVIAALIMTPALTLYATTMGLLGGALIANTYFDVTWTAYLRQTFLYISQGEIVKGILVKGVVFGALYSIVCVYKGLRTTGGAEGVGRATTSGVVSSLAGILVANYILTRYLFG